MLSIASSASAMESDKPLQGIDSEIFKSESSTPSTPPRPPRPPRHLFKTNDNGTTSPLNGAKSMPDLHESPSSARACLSLPLTSHLDTMAETNTTPRRQSHSRQSKHTRNSSLFSAIPTFVPPSSAREYESTSTTTTTTTTTKPYPSLDTVSSYLAPISLLPDSSLDTSKITDRHQSAPSIKAKKYAHMHKLPFLSSTQSSQSSSPSSSREHSPRSSKHRFLIKPSQPSHMNMSREDLQSLITASDIDQDTRNAVEKNRESMVKVAQEFRKVITDSTIGKIYYSMTPEVFRNPHVLCLVNCYFLHLIPQKDANDPLTPLLYEKTGHITPEESNADRAKCFDLLKELINKRCNMLIKWPTVSRQEDEHIYFKQLFAHNRSVDYNTCYYPFSAGVIATLLLYQIEREPQVKLKLLEITRRPELHKYLSKQLEMALPVMEAMGNPPNPEDYFDTI